MTTSISPRVSRPLGMVFQTPLAELGFRLERYADDARDHTTQPTALTQQNLNTSSLFLAHAVRWLLLVSPPTPQTDLALRIPLPTRQIPLPITERVEGLSDA